MRILETRSFKLAVNEKGSPNSKRLAIALPGRLDTKDYDNFNKHLELLASKGFYAISFDPPGTWESPGSTDLFSTTNYIKAVNELIKHFGNKPTLLLGHSRGGATATLAGTNNPYVIGLILINPSLGSPSPPDEETLRSGVYIDYRDLPPGTKRTKEKKKFKASLGYFKDGAKYNDAETVKECTLPKLVFYSENDEFNSPDEVEKIFSKVKEPKEMHKIKGTHDYRLYPDVIQEVNEKMGKFIDKQFPENK